MKIGANYYSSYADYKNIVNNYFAKKNYLNNENDFTHTINNKISLYDSTTDDTEERQQGGDHKAGTELCHLSASYSNLYNNLLTEKQNMVNCDYGQTPLEQLQNDLLSPHHGNYGAVLTSDNISDKIDLDHIDLSKLNSTSNELIDKPYTWEDCQKSFCSFADIVGSWNSYKYSLYDGHFEDGAEVTNKVTNSIKQHLADGQSADWLDLSAHSLGLDATFASKEDYIKALDNASAIVKTYTDAIDSVAKTLPEDDFFNEGCFMDIRA